MRLANSIRSRRAAVLPLVVLCLVALMGMTALAIDIGMIAVARSQCQNAADASAMAGARTISGNSTNNYNFSAVPGNAITAASVNKVLSGAVKTDPGAVTSVNAYTYSSENVNIEVGAYTYLYNDDNPSKEGFQIQFPRQDTTEPYSAVRSTIKASNNYAFGRIFGLSTFNTSATAVAVHRPRDVIIIMDLSGSMRFQSLPGIYVSSGGTAAPSSTSRPRTKSMNPDPDYPKFGHYSDTTLAALFGNTSYSTGDEMCDPCNLTYKNNSGPKIVDDFYANATGSAPGTSNRAFSASSADYATTPGGDNFLRTVNNTTGNPYAKTVNEIINGSAAKAVAFENFGYSAYVTDFKGYTEGPSYWGKTFFVWPPDPRGSTLDPTAAANHADNGAKDWRQRFFFKYNTATNTLGWLDHTNILFDAAGTPATDADWTPGSPVLRMPYPEQTVTVTENGVSATYGYRINYAAILKWLQTSPTHFPSRLRAGRIKYYDALPDYTDTTLNSRWWTDMVPADKNERFWKEYIDFTLGLCVNSSKQYRRKNHDPNGNSLSSVPLSALIGNGDYCTWGTFKVSQKPDVALKVQGKVNGAHAIGAGNGAFLSLTNMPSAPDVAANWYVRFTNHSTLYKVTSVNTSSGTVNGIKIDANGSTAGAGLLTAAVNNEVVTFYNHQWGNVNNVAGYAVGAGYSSDILVKNLAIDPDISAGAYIRFSSDPTSIYYLTQVTSTAGVVTGFRIDNGKGAGLNKAISDNDEIKFFSEPSSGAGLPGAAPSGLMLPSYMHYNDNPHRPRHQLWFGPQTFLDYLGNYNTTRFWWPGNVHEAQCWACKVGIQTAIDDIKNNHPSDFIGMAFFSDPRTSATDTSGQHNRAIVPLGRNYQMLKDSLWFPPSTITSGVTEVTPYDADFQNAPRAKGGTAPGMGFMIAYNLLSSSTTDLRLYAQPQPQYRGSAGGLGRKGATRLVIFETDGAPNTRGHATFKSAGKDSYYQIRFKHPDNYASTSNEFPNSGDYSQNEVYSVVDQICKSETDGNPGYSTTRKPVLIYPLGYGSLFDTNNKSATQTDALNFMQTVAFKGNTAKTTSGADFPDWQRIYGTNDQRIERMRVAFTTIMQSGIQVSLIE